MISLSVLYVKRERLVVPLSKTFIHTFSEEEREIKNKEGEFR